MAGDRGDDLAGVQRTKRSGVNGTTVSSSSGPRSRTREGNRPAVHGHGNGPLSSSRRRSRPDLAVRHRDEGAALIAAFASEPARRNGPQPGDTLRASKRGGWRRARVRDGRPSGARRWAFDSGSTRSATARPCEAGTRPKPRSMRTANAGQHGTPGDVKRRSHHRNCEHD